MITLYSIIIGGIFGIVCFFAGFGIGVWLYMFLVSIDKDADFDKDFK